MGVAAASSWTDDDLLALDGYLGKVEAYINMRKRDALKILVFLKGLQEKLEKKYTPTYNMVGEDLARDDPGHAAAVAFFAEVQCRVQCAMEGKGALCQNRNTIPMLFEDGAKVKPEADKILAGIAKVSGAAFKESPLKKFFRVVEKAAMKLAGDPTLGRADNVRWRVLEVVRLHVAFPSLLRASFDPFRSQAVQSACCSSTTTIHSIFAILTTPLLLPSSFFLPPPTSFFLSSPLYHCIHPYTL